MSDLRCVNGHAVPADFRFCGVCFAAVQRPWSTAAAAPTVAPSAFAASARTTRTRSHWRWTGTRILKVLLVLVAVGLLAQFGLSLRTELENQQRDDGVEHPAGSAG